MKRYQSVRPALWGRSPEVAAGTCIALNTYTDCRRAGVELRTFVANADQSIPSRHDGRVAVYVAALCRFSLLAATTATFAGYCATSQS
jgi:hypothetical protein